MKIFVISDLHIGKYSGGSKWINMMEDYFYNFLIPFLKENTKPNDKLMVLGDIYDNRIALDLNAINLVIRLFEDLSKITECHILLGNHDQRLMKDPSINAIATIRNIKNVFTYTTHTTIKWCDKTIGIMPWLNDKEDEIKVLNEFNGYDYVFCHSDLNGCRTQVYPTRPKNKGLLDIEDFSGIGRVMSGHIHIRQTINNFTFVGSPYQLDRNDYGNRKGVHIINLKNKKELFVENDYSPEFIRIEVNNIDDIEILKQECNNDKINYIDLFISKKLLIDNPRTQLEIDKIKNKTRIVSTTTVNDVVLDNKKRSKNVDGKSIKDISLEYIDEFEFDDMSDDEENEYRKTLKNTMLNIFEIYDTSKK